MLKKFAEWVCYFVGHDYCWLYDAALEPTHIKCLRCGREEEHDTAWFINELRKRGN